MDVGGYFARLGALGSQTAVTDGVGAPLVLDDGIARLVDQFAALPAAGAKAMICGNGGSAAIASHFATDFTKNGRVPTLVFSDAALLTCLGNDYGYAEVYAKPIEAFAKPGDLAVLISSSGTSPNMLRAAEAARRADAVVVTLSGFKPDNPLRGLGDLNFHVASDSYGFVECAHFVLFHATIDALMKLWPETASRRAAE